MGNVGFEVTADISAFEGPYTVLREFKYRQTLRSANAPDRLPIAIAAVNVDKG